MEEIIGKNNNNETRFPKKLLINKKTTITD